jgi:ribose transport system permease protein
MEEPETGAESQSEDTERETPPARRSAVGGLVRFLGHNRGVTALLAVVVLGVLFSPQAGVPGPYLVNLLTGKAVPLRAVSDDGSLAWNPPLFFSPSTHADLLFEYSEYGILATGMTLVILLGGIDLSVGSVLGVAAMVFAHLHIAMGLAAGAALAGAVVAGGLCGVVNGVLVSRLGLQPFVATLAVMVAARGMAKVISGGAKIQVGAHPWYHVQEGTPAFMEAMTRPGTLGFLRPVVILFLLTIIAMAIIVKYTRFGRYLYAIGGNEEAARLSGVPVHAVKLGAYALCGLFAGLAGVCNACKVELGNPEAGFTFELDAIAAVVIGGTSLMGGRGSMVYTILGTLIVGDINKILSLNSVPEAYRLLAKGLIIVAAVVIQQRSSRR